MKKCFLILSCFVAALPIFAAEKPKIELSDGDRAVFIGGVFMEREQEEGYIETALTLSFPDSDVSYRNLGWGGDTVESHLSPTVPARPGYVPNLFSYVEQLKPTVIFVSYGMMESFHGEQG